MVYRYLSVGFGVGVGVGVGVGFGVGDKIFGLSIFDTSDGRKRTKNLGFSWMNVNKSGKDTGNGKPG